jgi:hypothetical protein
MTPAAKRWIEAAKVLGVDPSVKVRCPQNDDGTLTVRDVRSGDMLERYLVCDQCGAFNIILIRTPAK